MHLPQPCSPVQHAKGCTHAQVICLQALFESAASTGNFSAVSDFYGGPADWDNPCPTRVGSSLSGTSGKPPLPPPSKRANSTDSPATAKKPKKSLTTHNDADRVRRVNALIAKNEATPGFFLEVIPDRLQTQTADERWFMQVTERKITDGHVLGTWCQANSLISAGTEQRILLSNVKDYGLSSTFMS